MAASAPSLVAVHGHTAGDVVALALPLVVEGDHMTGEMVASALSLVTAPIIPEGEVQVQSSPPPTWEAFLAQITKQAIALLSGTNVNSHRQRKQSAGPTPRCSRPIVGAPVEFKVGDLEQRSKKKVMRNLEIIGEHEGVDHQAQDE